MRKTQRVLIITSVILSMMIALYMMLCAGCWTALHLYNGSTNLSIGRNEKQLRQELVRSATKWLDTEEGSAPHLQILQIYNDHEPLARDYTVKATDSWCAVYASMVAIEQELTDIIPTECGCERQIELWKSIGCWVENDNYMPITGDYIYYNWDDSFNLGENSGWADHVGIVTGTAGPMIKVIEGNKDDRVTYRILYRGDYRIRGYGLPDYSSKIS